MKKAIALRYTSDDLRIELPRFWDEGGDKNQRRFVEWDAWLKRATEETDAVPLVVLEKVWGLARGVLFFKDGDFIWTRHNVTVPPWPKHYTTKSMFWAGDGKLVVTAGLDAHTEIKGLSTFFLGLVGSIAFLIALVDFLEWRRWHRLPLFSED